jgi:hypothetical protein
MVGVTTLLDKLTALERSIAVEEELALRKRVIDAQDCVLLIQREMVETLRQAPRNITLQIVPDVSSEPRPPQSGWRRVLAAIRLLGAASPSWKR